MPAPLETDLAKIRRYCEAQVPARLRESDPTGIFWGQQPPLMARSWALQSRYAKGFTGARCGSQCAQIRLDAPRRLRNITAGGRLLVRLPQTGPDAGFVPGGQGVAGSCKELRRLISSGFPGLHEHPRLVR